jgi:hypothetical protein
MTDNEIKVDVFERTKPMTGNPQAMDRRLFMQLLVYECEGALETSQALHLLESGLTAVGANSVVYEDVNNPRGLGVLTWSDNPADFVTKTRVACGAPSLAGMRLVPDFTMIGRTYATGYEPDLAHWLLTRPQETAQNPAWPWAVWYPLRRSGAFARLDGAEQGRILREHADIGKAYGGQDLAHDIRLACHGLDAKDNEFVIGLIGKELHPLSHVVQAMRKTRQTAEFINQMGPFFVGHAAVRTVAGG